MKLIKKYWAIFIGTILSAFGIFTLFNRKKNAAIVNNIDNAINQNNIDAANAAGKAAVIEDIKQDINQDIVKITNHIEEITDQRDNITVTTPSNAKAAKTNILNKTTKKKQQKGKL